MINGLVLALLALAGLIQTEAKEQLIQAEVGVSANSVLSRLKRQPSKFKSVV